MKGWPHLVCAALVCLLPTAAAMAQNATVAKPAATPPALRIAITFDDLPWASLDPNTPLPAHETSEC